MTELNEVKGWLGGRVPREWGSVTDVQMDAQEIIATVKLTDLESVEGDLEAARQGRVQQFRESTRDERIGISREAERQFGRALSWAAEIGETKQLFTHLALPVMTRLRLPEREVLDALVDAGVARSRAHALAWCVALVRQHEGDWLKELKQAMEGVARARSQAPKLH